MLTLDSCLRVNGYSSDECDEVIEALFAKIIKGKSWIKRVVMGYAFEDEAVLQEGYLYHAYLFEYEGFYGVWNERDQELNFEQVVLLPSLELAQMELSYLEHFLY